VSKVLLVGGATRMPAVQRLIINMTGLVPVGADGGVDPDEAVALGAAVQVGRHDKLLLQERSTTCSEAWRSLQLLSVAQESLQSV
jgi:molecular chaperone DnaK (HSP70)